MKAMGLVKLLCHSLEVLPVLTPLVNAKVCQIVVNHLMNHNILELLLVILLIF